MPIITDRLQPELVPVRSANLIPSLVLTFLGILFLLPLTGFTAQASLTVNELNLKAQQAYSEGRYAEAIAIDQEIAENYPGSKPARYAVQMLGTLYEDNLVDLKKAIKWDREFMEKYADSRQVSFYKEKLVSLEKLTQQEEAFKTYQKIRFANQGDEIMVKKFEALLKEHPDFLLKDKVRSELGYAYARMDKRKQSYLAFEALAEDGGNKISTSDRVAYETASRYWNETSAWGWVAWCVVASLWFAVLLMKPWKHLTRSSTRKFLVLALFWVLLTAIRMPTFYSLESEGYPIVIPDTAVYIASGINLTVLLWLFLLTRGEYWQTRPRALHWLSPVLALMMTAAVFYLFIVHQPNGPQIMDVFVENYRDWTTWWHL